jgi:hypothetical protein
MIRPIMLAVSVLPVLAGQVTVLPPGTGTMTAVKDVTNTPRVAEIEFVDFEFQRPQPAHEGVFLFQIDGEPASGIRYPVEANIGGEEAIATASFDVIAEDGTIIQPLPIARGERGGYSQFIGMMNVPSQPFRILLSGQSVDGRRFQRVYERLFRPGKGSLDIPPDAPVPPEYAGQRRLMEEDAKRQLVEVETFVAANATVPLVMPRLEVSRVVYAPLLSAGGRPIGVRITYDVEFSQAGEYDPQLSVYAGNPEENGILGKMRVLNSNLEPLPRLAHAPQELAGSNHRDSVLAYGADFLYEARTAYHFTVDLVPGFIATGGGGSPPCIWREGFRTTHDPEKAFASLLAREGPSTYRVSIGGNAFEGRIEKFAGEGTLYRNFVADGTQDCAQPGR